MVDRDEDVVVIGAGIAGLSCALAAQQAGRSPVVLERRDQLAPEGAGITLWPNAVRCLDLLGAGDAARQAGHAVGRSEIRDADGSVLAVLDASALARRIGAPMVALHRAALHAALLDAVGHARVRTGAAVQSVTPAGDVELAGGARLRARAVIGADGMGSVARAAVAPGVAPRSIGLVAWRAVIEHAGDSDGALEAWAEGRIAGAVPVGDGQTYWWAAARQDDDDAMAAVAAWAAPLGPLVAGTPAGEILQHDLAVLPRLRRWTAGRVALAGDAAHAMTPNLGQGAGQAVEDAVALRRALTESDDDAQALARYARARRARAADVQRESARMTRLAHLRGGPAALRDLVLRHAPSGARERRLVRLATSSA